MNFNQRIREQVPRDQYGAPLAKAPSKGAEHTDVFGEPNAKIKTSKNFKPERVKPEVVEDNYALSGKASVYDWQPVRDLLAKHGKVLAAVCGPDAIDELTAITGGGSSEPEPVRESYHRASSVDFDFSEPGSFAARYSGPATVAPPIRWNG